MRNGDLPVWRCIPWRFVDAFLADYYFHPQSMIEASAIRQYLQTQINQDELTEWYVSVRTRPEARRGLGVEPAMPVNGTPVARIGRTRLRNTPQSIGSLVNPATVAGDSGDELVGLAAEQIQAARDEAAASSVRGDFPWILRGKRDKREGLLLLYPISPVLDAREQRAHQAASVR